MGIVPDRRTLMELRRLGLRLDEIAEKYGVEESAVWAMLTRDPAQAS